MFLPDQMGEVATPDVNSDFFDQIDDLLNFPTEEVEEAMPVGGDSVQSWPTDDIFSLRSSTFGDFRGGCDDPEHELAVPCDNLAELEWLSNFVEDSFSVGSIQTEFQNSINGGFRSSSPVSVLESSSCSSKTLDVLPSVPGRARTKRPRPPILPPRPANTTTGNANDHTMMISPSSSTTTFSGQYRPASKSIVESKPAKKGGGRKRKRAEQTGISLRKCLHCESQKTPQWRAGPLGPKTLCNACGVRYKSGRLFPEYRPAASPTFQAAQHSNSHRKVMEMRVKRRPMAGGGGDGDTELVYQRNTILNYM